MLGAVVFTLAELVGLTDDFGAPVVPWRVTLFFLAGTAAVAGYVALLSAIQGASGREECSLGCVLGIAANVYAICIVLDLNPNAMRDWYDWYWFGSPIAVALAHVVAYFVRARQDRGRTCG